MSHPLRLLKIRDFFVFILIFFERGLVFYGLRNLSLFHAFSHVLLGKVFLGVHDVELVVQPGPGLGDGEELGEIHKGAVGHDIVVWLHHGRGHLGGGVGHKLQFGLLAVVHGVTLHEKGSDADAGSSPKEM